MHQICAASAHCRRRTGFFHEAFHVMTLLLSRDEGGKQEELAGPTPCWTWSLSIPRVCAWGCGELVLLSSAGLSLHGNCSDVRWGWACWPPLSSWEDVFSALPFEAGDRRLPFDRLWWQAKTLGEPVPDIVSQHSLRLGPQARKEANQGGHIVHEGHIPDGLA